MPGERHGEGKENRECPVFCGVKEDEVIEPNGRRGAVRCQGCNHLCRKSVWGKGEKLLHVPNFPGCSTITLSLLFLLIGASVLGFFKLNILNKFLMFYIISFSKETVIFLTLPSLLC